MSDAMCGFLEDPEFVNTTTLDGDDLFAIFESLDSVSQFLPLDEVAAFSSGDGEEVLSALQEGSKLKPAASPKSKRATIGAGAACSLEEVGTLDGHQRMSHITVERNRRKQMNKHLSMLRSLMPTFYVKRGDQASIIGGVVDYIKELQQVLRSLEAKKQRKVYNEILCPRLVVSSPRVSLPLSPRKPALSPRLNLPISPRTPQPCSPYLPRLQQGWLEPSPTSSSSSSIVNDNVNELAANSKSPIAEVEVKSSGSNVFLKTASPRIPGQVVKIIATLEELSLEILNVSIRTVDETMLNSFTIKIGIECQLSAEELAQQIQQTFC